MCRRFFCNIMKKYILFFACSLLAGLPLNAAEWVHAHERHSVSAELPQVQKETRARRVILMIGDGMSPDHVAAAWMCNKGRLNIDRLPVVAQVRTYSASSAITDSAAAGTAIACGHKTNNGSLGMDAAGRPIESIAKVLDKRGYKTGVVVTSSVLDATPAAFYAHVTSRQQKATIAQQLANSGLDVVIGGGEKEVPAACQELLRQSGTLLLLKGDENTPPAPERGDFLAENTRRALKHMENHPKGFFLMIEGSCIDKVSHKRDVNAAVQETLDFDCAVGAVLEWMKKHPDTLLIITSDHMTGSLIITDGSAEQGRMKGKMMVNHHHGYMVPVYAFGPGAGHFALIRDNTEFFSSILKVLKEK